mmetsp:Transcript_24275/g.66406  ORF Transcript_24275/g.66406 Transcript_24275/m.66406 type:complete len:225 (+) Transcript_24275:496-1170(+)
MSIGHSTPLNVRRPSVPGWLTAITKKLSVNGYDLVHHPKGCCFFKGTDISSDNLVDDASQTRRESGLLVRQLCLLCLTCSNHGTLLGLLLVFLGLRRNCCSACLLLTQLHLLAVFCPDFFHLGHPVRYVTAALPDEVCHWPQHGLVLLCEKGDGSACMPCPACAPNAVDVVCGGSRHVIVYDGVDAYEVHASPYEVRGDQHPCAPTPEVIYCCCARCHGLAGRQ